MIELFTSNTPNGKKITIMLEEINLDYKITIVNINKNEQFDPKFREISPFSKIPVITDHDNNVNIFESGAILMYLGEKSGKFYPEKNKGLIIQWLMAQMAYVGPLLGQHHQFHHYNPGKSKWGEDRYFKIAKNIYKDLNDRLQKSEYLAGEYSIADIATFPWIARHEWHDVGLKDFKHLTRWYNTISKRDAVIKGYDLLKRNEKIPQP